MCGLLHGLGGQYNWGLLHMNLPRAKARGFHERPEEARVVAVSSTGRLTGNLAAGSFLPIGPERPPARWQAASPGIC